jgi:hypothetical protein
MRTLSLLLAFSLSGAAQPIAEADAARARHLLSSPQWQDKAWGAYFAGRLHSADLEQPLLDALREAAALRDVAWRTEEYGYLTALFDAVVESESEFPPTSCVRSRRNGWPR